MHSREACVQGPERQVCTGWTTSSCPAHGPCECPHDNACGWRWGGPHRRTFIPNRGTSSRGPDTTYHGLCIFWLVGPFYFWLGPYLLLAGGVLLLAGAFLRRGPPLRGLWGFSGPLGSPWGASGARAGQRLRSFFRSCGEPPREPSCGKQAVKAPMPKLRGGEARPGTSGQQCEQQSPRAQQCQSRGHPIASGRATRRFFAVGRARGSAPAT